MSVWLAAADTEPEPACRFGCCLPVSPLLAWHLITTCTRLGSLVIDIDATDHAVLSSALTPGCRAVATFTDPARAHLAWQALQRLHPGHDLDVADLRIAPGQDADQVLTDLLGTADLVIARHHGHPSHLDDREGDHLSAQPKGISRLAALLAAGGHLVIVTGLHRADEYVRDPAPDIIRRAQQAGLTYLQHIVALHLPVQAGRLEPPPTWRVPTPEPAPARCAGMPISVRLHTDVLIFNKPRRTSRTADRSITDPGGQRS
ncbi:hypothetical protein [Spongiactinospora gelatinilytica]|uniref:hypothetical protein n=1 Tax=Spongiactinospora gelatinilytica TaxID=2666298 RepID=UPI0011B93C3C|nr:hypothetical protein [Spongiactinospora gelatinilytica]